MGKKSKSKGDERYKGLDVMLPQGARSRLTKAETAIDDALDLLPTDALDGSSADIKLAISHLHRAADNLSEALAYRKMLGVD